VLPNTSVKGKIQDGIPKLSNLHARQYTEAKLANKVQICTGPKGKQAKWAKERITHRKREQRHMQSRQLGGVSKEKMYYQMQGKIHDGIPMQNGNIKMKYNPRV
jgi:hypothetical protein